MEFNSHLVTQNMTERRAIAIDPSFIPKPGKKTPYMGSFWSGCSQSIKWGLEMMGIAAIDIDNPCSTLGGGTNTSLTGLVLLSD